jgi:hypothetical protein
MGRDIKQLDILDVEQDVSTVVEACCNQVPQDFMLWVQRNGTPIRQFGERNAMPLSIEAEFDPMMHGSFALHAFAKPHFHQQIDRALLKNAGTNRRFDFFSAPAFEHDRINAFPSEQERQQ